MPGIILARYIYTDTLIMLALVYLAIGVGGATFVHINGSWLRSLPIRQRIKMFMAYVLTWPRVLAGVGFILLKRRRR